MVIDTVLKRHGPKFNTVMSSFPGSLPTSRDPGFLSYCVFAHRTIFLKIWRNEVCFGIGDIRNVKS